MAKFKRRRRSFRRHKVRRAGSKSIPIAQTIASAGAIGIMLEPIATGQTGSAITSGNLRSLPGALAADAGQVLTTERVAKASTLILLGVGLPMLARMVGIRPRRLGRVRAF